MPEKSFASILDRFRKKKGDKADTGPAAEPKKPEFVLTEQENVRLKGYLSQAKEQEKSGNQAEALKLYSQYKQEFLAIRNRGKEGVEVSPEYLEALSEIFKGETLDRIEIPKPDELTEEYFDKMYPETQREEDKAKGLISFRPSWWNERADAGVVGPDEETWGQVYMHSMRVESAALRGTTVLTESIKKPDYNDGRQLYGTRGSGDPMRPFIEETLGKQSRFDLTWDQIVEKFLPKIKEEISKQFKSKGLDIPKFEVILTPALVANIQMTKDRPENSQTNTYEWTSTPLLKQDGTDSGFRLLVGHSGRGGAGSVRRNHREHHNVYLGFRLSVVFEK